MNVKVIDPRRAPESSSRHGSRDAIRADDRFNLLTDLKYLTVAYMEEALGESGKRVLSPAMLQFFKGQLEAEKAGIQALRRLGEKIGLGRAPQPRIDLPAGFLCLGTEAGVESFDPFAGEEPLITGALVLNALSQALIAGWLCESDAAFWRAALLPMLADDSRFEGLLNGALFFLGTDAECRASDLLALASGPTAQRSSGERLWSFELLRMAISRLACGGERTLRGGFFPEGMTQG